MTSLPSDRDSRKRLGAWYTPPAIVRFLVRWAVRSSAARVLDPSVGDGAFLVEAGRRVRTLGCEGPGPGLYGADISQDAVTTTADELSAEALNGARLLAEDFFAIEPPCSLLSSLPHVDAVVGNPPYIRYQRFRGRARALAIQRASDAGVQLSSLSSSWAAFVIHATSFLRDGGHLALVLPEELTHAGYAATVRAFLRRTFQKTTVIGFDEFLFPRSQERVVLLLAEGKAMPPLGQLVLARVKSPDDLDSFDSAVDGSELFEAQVRPEKWRAGWADAATQLLDDLVADGKLVPLADVGKASIGYVSGANEYFVLRPSEAIRRQFPAEVLIPTIVAARHASGAILSEDDVAAMRRRDERCLLWSGAGSSEHEPVACYLEEGRQRGIPARYKCRVRDPWYVVPGVTIPDAFLTYMAHEVPRLVLNQARTACTNNLLAVRFHHLDRDYLPLLTAYFYNSATMLSAERIGRHYGGGVLKLEPSEADRILVPSPAAICAASTVPSLDQVDTLLRSRDVGAVLATVDKAFLGGAIGLGPAEIQLIQESRARRQHDRIGVRRSLRAAFPG